MIMDRVQIRLLRGTSSTSSILPERASNSTWRTCLLIVTPPTAADITFTIIRFHTTRIPTRLQHALALTYPPAQQAVLLEHRAFQTLPHATVLINDLNATSST